MRGKKAIFFTILSLLFIDVFILSYQVSLDYTQSKSFDPIRSRIHSIEDFIDSFEGDANKALYISGYRAMITLNNYVTSYGIIPSEINDSLETVYKELLLYGRMGGSSSEAGLMHSQTLPDWLSKIEAFADQLDLNLTGVVFSDINIEHSSPYHLRTSMTMNYTLIDRRGTCSFNRTRHISTTIPIDGWVDPLYALRTGGVLRQIRQTNQTTWNPSSTQEHIAYQMYRNSTSAPSFLDRIQNKTDPTGDYGIEAFLNLASPEINDPSNHQNRSVIDYIYWNVTYPPTAEITVITTPAFPWFRLDEQNVGRYGLDNSTPYS